MWCSGRASLIRECGRVPILRRTLLRTATWVGRTTTGLPLTDAHNGLRAFTTASLQRLQLEQDPMANASGIQA